MALAQADLTNIYKAAYNANAQYGRDFWTAASGTGTLLRKQVASAAADAAVAKAQVAALQGDVTALKGQVSELKGLLTQALAALPKA